MFIMGTSSVLNLIPQDKIDLIAPIPQIMSVGFGPLGFALSIVPMESMSQNSIGGWGQLLRSMKRLGNRIFL